MINMLQNKDNEIAELRRQLDHLKKVIETHVELDVIPEGRSTENVKGPI